MANKAPRWENEELSDNTKDNQQCKTCMFQDGGTIYSNSYKKGFCAMYQYPDKIKPLAVRHNEMKCELYRKMKT